MREEFDFNAALAALQGRQGLTGKDGILTPLTRQQTVAVIATVLVEDLIDRKRYHDALALANIILKHYPNFAYLMVKKGIAVYYLLQAEFRGKYADALAGNQCNNRLTSNQEVYFSRDMPCSGLCKNLF